MYRYVQYTAYCCYVSHVTRIVVLQLISICNLSTWFNLIDVPYYFQAHSVGIGVYWRDPWNKWDLFAIILCIIGFFCRLVQMNINTLRLIDLVPVNMYCCEIVPFHMQTSNKFFNEWMNESINQSFHYWILCTPSKDRNKVNIMWVMTLASGNEWMEFKCSLNSSTM